MLVLYWKRDVVLDLDGKCVDCKSETDKKSEVRWECGIPGRAEKIGERNFISFQ